MKVHVRLHGILRDQLPPEAKGRASIDLGEEALVSDLLASLGIKRQVVVAAGDGSEMAPDQKLKNGDQVIIFSAISGG